MNKEVNMNKEIDLRTLQLLEYDILKKFADFCDAHGLQYSLIGGTLLGAVRHGGFIPWDDDIDVCMPRKDYDLFLELTKNKKISEELNVVAGDCCDDFSLPFAKITNSNATIIEDSQTHESQGSELWIDVMPVDGVGNDYNAAKRIIDKASKDQKGLGRATSIPWRFRPGEKGIVGLLRCIYRQLFRVFGYNYFKKRLIRLGKSNDFDSSSYVAIVVSGFYGYGEILEKHKMVKFSKMKFEDREFCVIGNWKEYLTGVYGDYMKLPPIKKQIAPHNLRVLFKEEIVNDR